MVGTLAGRVDTQYLAADPTAGRVGPAAAADIAGVADPVVEWVIAAVVALEAEVPEAEAAAVDTLDN